jgi:sugar phosphate isomerase/epimerase
MIYISTGQFINQNFVKSVSIINSQNINNIELSCGKYLKNYSRFIKKISKKNNLIFHNYFPRPKKDFFINLCSENLNLRNKSFKHIVKCINLCNQYKIKFYSFHAGFLFDPNINKIGKKYDKVKLFNKKKSLNIFIKMSNKLAQIAKKKNVILLIENNVITKTNIKKFKENPFLMTDLKDTMYIMKKTHKNVGLLTDLAHLKISANTQKFSKINYLKKTKKWNLGYHLSENDGLEDTNEKFNTKSWFWKHINKKIGYYTIEINFKNKHDIINQYILLKKKLNYAK